MDWKLTLEIGEFSSLEDRGKELQSREHCIIDLKLWYWMRRLLHWTMIQKRQSCLRLIRCKGQVTLIIVAHRLSTVKNCDVIYEVKDKGICKREKDDVLKNA